LKNRGFSCLHDGTESALRVGFGGGFGVKVAVLWLGRAACRATFDDSKRFK
jgi:hypothetical protein